MYTILLLHSNILQDPNQIFLYFLFTAIVFHNSLKDNALYYFSIIKWNILLHNSIVLCIFYKYRDLLYYNNFT